MGKYFSIIVVPHDDSKTRNFRVSYRLMYAVVTVVAMLVLMVVVFAFTWGRILLTAERAALTERENRELRAQVSQVDSLKLELMNLQALSIQIKGMLGVELTPEDSVLVASLSPDGRTPAIGAEDESEAVAAGEQVEMLSALPSMWPIKGYVTRGFRVTGGEKNASYHPGIDIAAERDTPIRAVADGVVESSRWDETYGWMVEVDHGYGIRTLYGHNSRNLVNVGDRITRGKVIAFVGSTGKSTAPHLHFEVRRNGVPVDPDDYLLN